MPVPTAFPTLIPTVTPTVIAPPRLGTRAPAGSTRLVRGAGLVLALALTATLAAPTLPAQAADLPASQPSVPDVQAELAAARREIAQENWAGAIRELERANAKDRRQAEVHSLLGYALRKSGQLDRAFAAYQTALKLDPRHVGAHEYLGEAYLMARQPDKAREQLAALKGLCGERCEAYQDLAKALAAYQP
jgi:Flp pilus assembly protein TadD